MNKTQVMALFTNDIDQRKAAIRAYVMDETNSYEDRLEVWKRTPPEFRHEEDWIWCHPTMLERDWLSTTPERHREVYLPDVPAEQGWDPKTDADTIRSFYLGCMASGIWGFVYDW